MQKMTLVSRPVLGHKLQEPVHTPSRQKVLHPTLLGQHGKHGAFPSKQLFSESPELSPGLKQTPGKILQDSVSAQNLKVWGDHTNTCSASMGKSSLSLMFC